MNNEWPQSDLSLVHYTTADSAASEKLPILTEYAFHLLRPINTDYKNGSAIAFLL